jgi:drug/metabolite transporter (DMT)-like permease
VPPLALAGVSIALWASLAYLSTLVPHVPPFLLVGTTLLIGSLPGLVRARSFTRDLRVLALGVYGLFGYHFCLFLALRLAPPVEANLINYLWPVLIVAFSPPLHWNHWAGAVLAFIGAALIATGGHFTGLTFQPGLVLALAAAVIWSSYSVLTRRLRGLSSAVVSQFCLVSGALSIATHAAIEPAAHLTAHDAAVLVALGLGPMGAAFYAWDAALKRGDPRVIGALSYLTPLLSTSCLVLFGGRRFTSVAALAMALIIAGAVLGSLGGQRRASAST